MKTASSQPFVSNTDRSVWDAPLCTYSLICLVAFAAISCVVVGVLAYTNTYTSLSVIGEPGSIALMTAGSLVLIGEIAFVWCKGESSVGEEVLSRASNLSGEMKTEIELLKGTILQGETTRTAKQYLEVLNNNEYYIHQKIDKKDSEYEKIISSPQNKEIFKTAYHRKADGTICSYGHNLLDIPKVHGAVEISKENLEQRIKGREITVLFCRKGLVPGEFVILGNDVFIHHKHHKDTSCECVKVNQVKFDRELSSGRNIIRRTGEVEITASQWLEKMKTSNQYL